MNSMASLRCGSLKIGKTILSTEVHKTWTKVIPASLSTSPQLSLDQKRRQQKGLHKNPNAFGPLTNRPDYTYLDGRPAPLGVGQHERLVKQKEYLDTVVRMTSEIDFAVQRHASMQQNKQETKKKIIDSKLRAKGHLLPLKP